ncbi:helix-turn-helix domain-containing protein [Streptomyces sp. NBC_00727]|uniref:helix-turn-helix domain-containing protein n=1 Tax=Streptomyces sp. NBC_00727 TaxID=2903675 RepID=UPI00386C95FC
MATPQVIAHPRTPSGSPGPHPDVTPTSGVIHVNVRHLSGFTVIGNHLAQHAKLSLTAIGLAAHIQSLPAGATVGIKALVARFPESEARIASALRELEAAGYLHRSRLRLPDGRVVTRTTSYNHPGTAAPATTPARQTPTPRPAQDPPPPAAPAPAPTDPPPPLPDPHTPAAQRHQAATALLAGLRRHAPQLVLSEKAIRELAPTVATWLERDVRPAAIQRALTDDLPPALTHPAGFVRTRLTALLPPPLPAAPAPAPAAIPLQDCDGCDRVFRAPEPGRCRDCRTDESAHSQQAQRC